MSLGKDAMIQILSCRILLGCFQLPSDHIVIHLRSRTVSHLLPASVHDESRLTKAVQFPPTLHSGHVSTSTQRRFRLTHGINYFSVVWLGPNRRNSSFPCKGALTTSGRLCSPTCPWDHKCQACPHDGDLQAGGQKGGVRLIMSQSTIFRQRRGGAGLVQ